MSARDRELVETPLSPHDADAFQRAWDGVTPFALATVVRTVGSTAARPGARAVVTNGGDLIGFVGGGCLRRAILEAGTAALAERAPRLIRSAPRDTLATGDDTVDESYVSGCPSRGEVEVFVEPVFPKAPLVVFGDTEIAWRVLALADMLGLTGVHVVTASQPSEERSSATVDASSLASLPGLEAGVTVVATQGSGDKAALNAALASACPHVLFIASRKKAAHWREALAQGGVSETALERLISPAGLAIGAKGAGEIALSIAAQIVSLRHEENTGAAGAPI